MLRNTCLALWIGSIALTLSSTARAQDAPSVFDYLGNRAARMSAALPPLPDSRDGWEKQRAEIVAKLATTLGLPPREPMRAAVTGQAERGDLVVESVAYLWAGQTYVSATVIRSRETAGRRGAVVIPSGFLGHHSFLPYRPLVEQMAHAGLLVLFIDDPRAGLRHAPRAGLYATAAAADTQVAGIQVFDALRGLDYLLTRADVDPGKIGIAGMESGALQACMAAAIEPRFQFVVAAGEVPTCERMIRATAAGEGPKDPSAFVAGLLEFGDTDRIAACVAPRPMLLAGLDQGPDTVRAAYRLHDAADQVGKLSGVAAADAEVAVSWLTNTVLPSLPNSTTAPASCGEAEETNFSMLRCMQQRAAALAEKLPAGPEPSSVAWLGDACGLDGMQPTADEVVKVTESGGLTTERLLLGVDIDFACPAVLLRPTEPGPAKHAAVVLSHDDRQCAASAKIAEAARRLATAGYWVIVPDHASVDSQSLQPLARADAPSFYGDDTARLYGPADAVGLPPLGLRVAENLAAFRHLADRAEVDPAGIVLAGLGIGGVDACLAAVLEEKIAGVASIDAVTTRDWVENAAPEQMRFFHVMPYLPGVLLSTDLDLLTAAVAPRPLTVVRLKGGLSRSGFDQIAATATGVYTLQNAADALLVLGPRDATEEREASAPEGVRRQLFAAARTLVPTPPTPGIVGTPEVLASRQTVDSAAGLIWMVAEMGGYEQEFADGGYRIDTWSFFNNNGDAQKGRAITPLIFKKEDSKYQLTAIGKTRTNTGTGLQTFAFEPVEGTDEVGDGYFFGWHTGDTAGNSNPGVVEFGDAADALMTILTADGAMDGQKLKIGAAYREQSSYRRQYSITAVSKKP